LFLGLHKGLTKKAARKDVAQDGLAEIQRKPPGRRQSETVGNNQNQNKKLIKSERGPPIRGMFSLSIRS